jgi:hypothetical protein
MVQLVIFLCSTAVRDRIKFEVTPYHVRSFMAGLKVLSMLLWSKSRVLHLWLARRLEPFSFVFGVAELPLWGVLALR